MEPQIPAVLKKKLVFGDEEQIKALRKYENSLKEFFGEEGESPWAVTIEIEGSMTVTVAAKSKGEAEQKARDEYGFDCSDYDISFSARKIETKPKPGAKQWKN